MNNRLTDRISSFGDDRTEPESLDARMARCLDRIEWLRVSTNTNGGSLRAIEHRMSDLDHALDTLQARSMAPLAPRDRALHHDGTRSRYASSKAMENLLVRVEQDAADALILLDTAFVSAMETRCEDQDRLYSTLRAMAWVSRQRRDGVLVSSYPRRYPSSASPVSTPMASASSRSKAPRDRASNTRIDPSTAPSSMRAMIRSAFTSQRT